MPSRLIDLTGQRFGRLRVMCRGVAPRRGQAHWLCRCDCGREVTMPGNALRRNRIVSCGCKRREQMGALLRTHGMTGTPEYIAWKNMIQRCYDENRPRFEDWGGRGIEVYDEWRRDFTAFLRHIGLRPSPRHSVDRIDNDGNYEPGNVRWATMTEQRMNRRDVPSPIY